MHLKPTFTLLALVVSLAVGVTAAIAGTTRATSDPGVSDSTILLGATAPLTGPDSAYGSIARGAEAYFKYVNARGGVNGRTILYKVADDASLPAQALPLTRQLVEQDKVFAVVGSVGTASNLNVRTYLNGLKVPQVFAGSGATSLGDDYQEYPYSLGFQPSHDAEGWVYGKYLARKAPGATIAVLFRGDDYGKDLLAGLKRGLQRSKTKVIAAQPYFPAEGTDVSSQMAKLKASGADTLAIFATARFATQAYDAARRLGWKPKQVVLDAAAATAASTLQATDFGQNKLADGTISIAILKDPTDSQWRKDAAMKLYHTILARYAPLANADDSQYVLGMAIAWTAVEALKKAGKDLTRASLLDALDTFAPSRNPFLLPGIAIKTTPKDRFPIEQMLLQRWQDDGWKSFGGLWTYRDN